jgi:hypothetical protein
MNLRTQTKPPLQLQKRNETSAKKGSIIEAFAHRKWMNKSTRQAASNTKDNLALSVPKSQARMPMRSRV